MANGIKGMANKLSDEALIRCVRSYLPDTSIRSDKSYSDRLIDNILREPTNPVMFGALIERLAERLEEIVS